MTPREANDLPTVCVLCSHNCGLRVDVADGKITEVRADESNPITRGYICNKAYSIQHYVEHRDRVMHPMKRMPNGEYEKVSWDEALKDIGQRLKKIRDQHSPRAIAIAGVGGQGNHLDAPYASAFLRGLGSPWMFNAFAQEKTQHPLVDGWMAGAPPSAFLHADLEHSEYVVILGSNPLMSNRARNFRDVVKDITREEDRTLVVIDPRETETAKRADLHVRVRPGGDAFLLLGMASELIKRELYDKSFVDERTEGFGVVADALAKVDLEEMAKKSGVDAAVIAKLAEDFAKAKSACMLFDLGVEQVRFSTLIAYLMRLVLGLTGNYAMPGGCTFAGMFSPSSRMFGEKKQFVAPGSGIAAIQALGGFGMFSPSILPDEIEADHPERIRAVIVEGSNPMLTAADTNVQRRAFEKLDLLVVIDPAFTETARMADYVLPAPVGYEKWEWSSFPNGYPQIYAQVRPPVVPKVGDAMPEPEIYTRLAEEMGIIPKLPRYLEHLGRGKLFLAALMARAKIGANAGELAARLVFWTYRAVGPHLPDPGVAALWSICHLVAMGKRKHILRAHPECEKKSAFEIGETLFKGLMDHPEGIEIMRLDPERNFEQHVRRGKVDLAPSQILPEIERALAFEGVATDEYPLVLFTGERKLWNANAVHRTPDWRKGRGPHQTLRIHPDDAASLGIAAGDQVRVETVAGAVELPAELNAGAWRGQVAIPHGFGMRYTGEDGELHADGVNVNELTAQHDRDPFTGIPHHKQVPCRVVVKA